ncbi:glycosyltransferase family 2 protein [Helicobacter sp.]|uniref:glycosyltransferase family 2 protein n=1 Tax=Helicobacter sp. TaxID=218 RepID=UPI0025C17C81|nr:glycosyltransferase family 2 protein [Helicobacter sp.]MBR2493952.1 glycosyltransferase family 2 protein [Helicobacter sp.]
MPPKISIIIPTYNVESYIERCLESCINQTLNDIEIIVVDDCGNDNSIKIAQSYANKDCRIKIIHNKKNLGTFATRIVGIRQALGEYIAFLDADDYLTANACEISYSAAQTPTQAKSTTNPSKAKQSPQEPDASPDIVFFGMRFEPRTFKRVSPPVPCKPLFGDEVLYEVFAHCATPPWHIWAKLYKASHIRDAIEKLVAHMGEDVRLTMAEDVLKSFWLTALAQRSIGIPDKLYVYCDSSSSITRKIDAKTRDKKIADIGQVLTELSKLSQVDCLRANASFSIAQRRAIAILTSVQVLEHRYDGLINGSWGGAVYIMACLKSLRYHRKWQTFMRLFTCIFSLGYIKL